MKVLTMKVLNIHFVLLFQNIKSIKRRDEALTLMIETNLNKSKTKHILEHELT